MRKLSLFAVTLLMTVIMMSCGKDNVQEEGTIPVNVTSGTRWQEVYGQKPVTPTWVNESSWIEGTWDGTTVYYFIVEGVGATEEKAEIACDLEKIETLASAIKQLATTKLGAASSGMLNDDEDIDTYFEKTTAAVSENVDISGAIMTDSYWLYGQLINDSEGTVEDQYYYYKRFVMPVEKIEEAMEDAWEATKADYPEELQDTVEDDLDYLMSDDDVEEDTEES